MSGAKTGLTLRLSPDDKKAVEHLYNLLHERTYSAAILRCVRAYPRLRQQLQDKERQYDVLSRRLAQLTAHHEELASLQSRQMDIEEALATLLLDAPPNVSPDIP